ncbi:MAG TPA: thiamine pyrophosphate-binding protein [Candidatus Mediterraneibacter excrementigallinarum]|nr:thiamine pyrophosphate-binding protein [Candidatus Mediterraneibacter excrementigallinarum]
MIKVSDYIIQYLETLGVNHMFMLPGGGAMHLNDSLGKSKKIKFVCCQNEQGAAIAAEAYARVNNKLGLLMVTTGPGGTNALTGVAGAFLESTPVLVLSGQVKRLDMIRDQGLRQQGMQELDIVSVVKPITKYAALVDEPEDVRYHLERALYEAMHGRKGPVWLDIPLDVQASMVEEENLKGYEPPTAPVYDIDDMVLSIINKLNSSERPVLLAGNGIRLSEGIEEFEELIKTLNIPVLTTWNGIDLIEESNPLYYGRPGGLGHRYANFIQQNSDFFMSIGARLNLLQTGYNFDGFARAAVKVMVDIDNSELHKINVRPDIPVCCDAKIFMQTLLKYKDRIKPKKRSEWFEYANRLKAKYPIVESEYWEEKDLVNTYCLLDTISDLMTSDDVYVSGSSGSCIDISMQTFRVKKGQRVFCTKGLASMGYGLPSSIGACLASGGKRTVGVNGDGGFVMNIQELETIRRLHLPIKIFVLCNKGYGAIKATQTNIFAGHLVACNEESDLTIPPIGKIAEAYGLKTYQIHNNTELRKKVEEVLEFDGPVICEVFTPIGLTARPKQVSYKRKDGQMESKPLEYMNPPLDEKEFEENMLIPLFKEQ